MGGMPGSMKAKAGELMQKLLGSRAAAPPAASQQPLASTRLPGARRFQLEIT